MAKRGTEGPQIVLIDTNVIVWGAIDFFRKVDSPEARIWSAFLEGEFRAVFSDALLSEITRVARRLAGKDFASRLRWQITKRGKVVSREKLAPYVLQFQNIAPRKDVVHAALAVVTRAEYIVSSNRKFLRSVKGVFKCMTPKEFVRTFQL